MSESKRKQGHDGGGSNKRGKYFQANKSAAIPLNSRGFLITCLGGKEFQASREALSVLNEYYEKACPAKPASSSKPGGGDLSNELEAEIQQLKTEKDHLFNFHKTNVNGLIYISMKTAEGPCPVELISSMAADVKATQQCKSRLCLRFMPVQVVCYASLDDIRKASEDLVKAAFPAGDDIAPIEYAVVYEHRASVTLDRLSVINAVVDHVPKPHKVNLKEPKKTILVQLIKSCCALSVVQNYKEYNKFNMREMCMTGDDEAKQDKAGPSSPANEGKTNATAASKEPGDEPSSTGAAEVAGDGPADADADIPAAGAGARKAAENAHASPGGLKKPAPQPASGL